MTVTTPTLFIFAGLPGSGKSTIAKMLAAELNCAFLRIDTIEQGLRDLCSFNVEGEGYRLSYRIAADILSLGNHVVADSCNPINLTRDEWLEVAHNQECRGVNIEVICSDKSLHQKRVEERKSEVANLIQPTWSQVVHREYDPWIHDRIVLDTAGVTPDQSFQALLQNLNEAGITGVI